MSIVFITILNEKSHYVYGSARPHRLEDISLWPLLGLELKLQKIKKIKSYFFFQAKKQVIDIVSKNHKIT